MIIPESMRKEMLQIVQESHMGMVHCKQLARDIMYWPGMNRQIEDIVYEMSYLSNTSEVPTEPWSILAADHLDCNGVMYLIVIDYYFEFIEVKALKEDTKSQTVIEGLTKVFAVHGIPDKLLTTVRNSLVTNSSNLRPICILLTLRRVRTTTKRTVWLNAKIKRSDT